MKQIGIPVCVLLLSATIMLLLPGASQAASCTVTARAVPFGNYNPFSINPLNRTARITAVCKGNGRLTVALSTGQSGSYNPRYMISAITSDQLDYNLYTTAARVIIFGDGAGGTQTVSKNFKNNTVRVNVYGQITVMQNIAPGIYSDNIVATVTF